MVVLGGLQFFFSEVPLQLNPLQLSGARAHAGIAERGLFFRMAGLFVCPESGHDCLVYLSCTSKLGDIYLWVGFP